MKKRIIDGSFILIAGAILILLSEFNLLEQNIGYALIPLLIAYYLGQYVQKQFNE